MYEQLTEDQWVERFGGYVDSPDGEGNVRWQEYDHIEALNDYHRQHRLWTVVEGEWSAEYLVPGFHIVNRTGFAVSVLPYGEDFDGEAEYMEPQCEACREFVDFGDISEDGRCGVCVTHEIYPEEG
jgi:hypothetical protein